MSPFDKKAYWKKRMSERAASFIRTIDPFEKEIRDMYKHSVSLDQSRLTSAFQKIGEGFGELLNALSEQPEKTKEGVVDLSKV